jgi:hypothetical protein
MRLKIIGCNVLTREINHWAARSPHIVDVLLLERTLHNDPDDLRRTLQAAIDESKEYDAVVLGYGLCSNGAAYLVARDVPVVIPRAHDCMTLFLGSRDRYQTSFDSSPGTYYYTAGWVERAGAKEERTTPEGLEKTEEIFADYVRRFGEDNAQYLFETLHTWWKTYTRAAFIAMGLPDAERFETVAREMVVDVAREFGWEFEDIGGDQRLFSLLASGEYNPHDFLIARPGEQIVPSYHGEILMATREHQPIPPRAKRVL